MATIPRGIQEVEWTRKDGTKGVRYRLRINRQGLKYDALFDELETAIEALNNSKTELGRTALKDFLHAEMRKTNAFYQDSATDLGNCLALFYKEHFEKPETNPMDKKANTIYQSLAKTISTTLIQDNASFENVPPLIRAKMNYPDTIPLGNMDPFKIEARDINSYIKARLATKRFTNPKKGEPRELGYISKATVTKELSFLSSFFSNFHSYGGKAYESLKENNPVKKANKRALAGANKKRERRLSEAEEQELFKALQRCRNKDMVTIFQLAISSGMRRSEILFLEWKQINFQRRYIELYRTKNGEPIKIQLLPSAWEELKKLKHKPNTDRLFKYTQDGFKSNFQRVLGWAKIEGYRFHDLRSEFITRV
ncbi:site-specific integrase [Diaphorobacter aerolatus]|uniref:Site-specific integrase n=1 Tax=Diaphorobacter aerolatus TaxID=1288495 RepID=A0A7H0GJ82_9BURK|nr:site-specific integrase [Diaphorobacter aerolatus]QNP48348.1 site-specific integrase [Diaphorobacter aerolatus]